MSERQDGDSRSLREQELDKTASQDGGAMATGSGKKDKKNRAAKGAASSASSSTAGLTESAESPQTEDDSAVTRERRGWH